MPELQGGSTYLNVEYASNIEKKTLEKLNSDDDEKEHDKDSDKNSDISGKRSRDGDVDLFDDDDDIDIWSNEPPSRKLKVDNDEKEGLFDEEFVSDHTIDDD